MPTFGKRVDRPGGNRRTLREPVVLAAAALTLDRSRSVILEDLSSTGARLRGSSLPQDGDELLVKVGPIDVLASVAWTGQDECGITFDRPLDPSDIEQFKHEGQLRHVLGIV
ncbi:MAG TPA: PilZ domain-containing protein [Sphingomicrobium sp.]|jgi:hypothetical protein|nr:PilZ domain-containing protein [Sphingomicrobium sp.]